MIILQSRRLSALPHGRMEVDFWGVKSSGCENSHATEMLKHSLEKLKSIPKKKRSECQSRRKSKKNPASIPHFPRLFDQNYFTIQMSLGGFKSKISHGSESRKIWIFAALTFISFIFRYEILYAKYIVH
jgi:hypothetical protein